MPTFYDIQQDELYKQGVEQGIEKGIERGIEQGIEKGIQKITLRCLDQGKGYEEITIITGLTVTQVKDIDNQRKK
ncbi:MAG: hypothetical protein R3E32_14595 [Chitinophagales bacterium]